jgi:2-polyprenyl-3-methyl-5-hydroxy-6-metoxy-1,4-benzoquinol methylase
MLNKAVKWSIAQNLEIRWWKNYLVKKDVAPYLEWKKKYWQNLLQHTKNYFTINEGVNVLDIGCGPSGMYMILPHCKVDALDPLISKYELELPHFKQSYYPSVSFFNSPFEQFIATKQYDFIFCMNAINHVQNIEKCYTKLASFLKPGGYLVITIDAHNYNLLKTIFKIVPGDALHPHQYNLEDYNHFLVKNGISILENKTLKKELIFNHYLQIAKKN